jgi:hypothetical protein
MKNNINKLLLFVCMIVMVEVLSSCKDFMDVHKQYISIDFR